MQIASFKLYQNLLADHYTADSSKIEPPTLDDFAIRIKKYEEDTKNLLALMIHGCYWSEPSNKALRIGCIERIASSKSIWISSRYTELYNLRYYPALILLYGGCISSLANNNYRIFSSLLMESVIRDLSEEGPAVLQLHCYNVLVPFQFNFSWK